MLQIASIVNALYCILQKVLLSQKHYNSLNTRTISSYIYCILVQIIYKKGLVNPLWVQQINAK